MRTSVSGRSRSDPGRRGWRVWRSGVYDRTQRGRLEHKVPKFQGTGEVLPVEVLPPHLLCMSGGMGRSSGLSGKEQNPQSREVRYLSCPRLFGTQEVVTLTSTVLGLPSYPPLASGARLGGTSPTDVKPPRPDTPVVRIPGDPRVRLTKVPSITLRGRGVQEDPESGGCEVGDVLDCLGPSSTHGLRSAPM